VDQLRGELRRQMVHHRYGTYKVYIDAVEPYKDVIKEGVQVTDGGSADLGEILLQK
jgi:hypothetical protein